MFGQADVSPHCFSMSVHPAAEETFTLLHAKKNDKSTLSTSAAVVNILLEEWLQDFENEQDTFTSVALHGEVSHNG